MMTMVNSDRFSFRRVGLLIRKSVCENRVQYIQVPLTILGIMLGSSIFSAYNHQLMPGIRIRNELVLFLIVSLISMIYSGSSAFRTMRSPMGALSTLMCPATHIEGVVARWIIAVPLFLVWLLISSVLADLGGAILQSTAFGAEFRIIAWWDLMMGKGIVPIYEYLLVILFIQSFFFLGGILWPRRAFIKTSLALFVTGIVYMVTVAFMIKHFLLNRAIALPSGTIDLTDGMEYTMLTGCILFNYLMTWMRFRESEIINRW